MERGKRYYEEPKLNVKKVIAVILAILVIIMFIFALKKLISEEKTKDKSNITGYFPVYTNNKWGVINEKGDIVIDPTYGEYIIIPNNKKDVFICTYDVNYDEGTYKTKVINASGNEIFSGYDLISPVYNYDSGKTMFFEDNVLLVKKDGKCGLVNYSGDKILGTDYDSIEALLGVENSFVVKKDGKLGLVDNQGKTIIDTKYKQIKAIGDNYQNGYIVKDEDDNYGVIDFTGAQVLENKYEDIANVHGNGMYVVKEDDKLELVNKSGDVIFDNFDSIKSIDNENVIVSVDGKYGVKNIEGEEIISTEYQDLTYAFSNYYIAKKDDKYGIIDTDEDEKLDFDYEDISYRDVASFFEAEKEGNSKTIIIDSNFEEKLEGYISEVNVEKGYFRIKEDDDYKYYNFKFEEKEAKDVLTDNTIFLSRKDGKYGFVDKKGEVVVNYIYDDAREQNQYGFAAVKKDGKWGSIDKDGKVVVEPKYELDSNVIESFIGKWHISVDLNAFYYTDK